MTDHTLMDQSEIIIAGIINSIEQDTTSSHPQTLFSVLVTETLKGTTHQNEIIVAIPGGLAQNGMYLKIAGAPRFSLHEEVLLFLDSLDDNFYTITQFIPAEAGSQFCANPLDFRLRGNDKQNG
ncbi:MAG TPA: hypothetical protein EYG88_04780 [Desulfocapsa sulfexigens]|nr:hypothetical protein [Desulfocapsa sulfexigens]